MGKWPNLRIAGCRFHLRQAWYRQIQHLGLQQKCQKSKSSTGETVLSDGGRWIRYVFGLTFLKPEEVHGTFISDLLPMRPTCAKLNKFTKYLLKNYVRADTKSPPLPVFGHIIQPVSNAPPTLVNLFIVVSTKIFFLSVRCPD